MMSDNTPTSEQSARAIQLICLLCDQLLTAEQMAELDQLVVRFPSIRRSYVEFMSLHADLRQQAALVRPEDLTDSSSINAIIDRVARQRGEQERDTASADLNETQILPAIAEERSDSLEQDLPASIPLHAPQEQPNKRFPWRLVASVVLILGISVLWGVMHYAGVHPDDRLPPGPECILASSINANWSDPANTGLKVGSVVSPRSYDLTSGVIKLDMAGRSTVVVEGPARFQIVSYNRVRMLGGKLCAQLLVKGSGLTVLTPDLTAVDMGTEFAVDVQAGKQTHLEVFQGAVRAEVPNSATTQPFRSVVAGDAVVVNKGSSTIEKDVARPLAFLRPSQVQAADLTSFQRWNRFSQIIRDDPDLTAYYTFDKESAAANLLENRAKHTTGSFNGVLGTADMPNSAPQWIPGRWPDKSALQFGGDHYKAVAINSEAGMISDTALTICCWIKRDDLNRSCHLLAGEAEASRSFNIGLICGKNNNAANLINMTWAQFNVASAPGAFSVGNWEFVAVSSTVEHGTEFYLDGKLVSATRAPSSPPVIVKQLMVGASIPGNRLSNNGEYFSGAMDELLVYRRALSGQEIEHLFRMGLPD